MKNILIADDHSVVHVGLQNLLEENFDFENFIFVTSGDKILSELKKNKVELIFWDISMPENDIFNLIKEIRKLYPKIKIVVYSMMPSKIYALRTIEAGANGYIGKAQSKQETIEAIKKVIGGKKYVDDEVLYNSLEKKIGKKNGFESLSNQELTVLDYLINGDNNNTISIKMNLHSATVGTYKNRIFEKLQVKNFVELLELYKTESLPSLKIIDKKLT